MEVWAVVFWTIVCLIGFAYALYKGFTKLMERDNIFLKVEVTVEKMPRVLDQDSTNCEKE